MRTAQEMRNFSANYSMVQKGFAIVQTGVKLEKCRFEDVVYGLQPDEDVLFCFAALPETAVAFTNKRIIIARDPKLLHGNNSAVKFYSYDNINSISSDRRMVKINTIGDDDTDMAFGNLQENKILEAISMMQDITAKYKTSANSGVTQIIQQNSTADELKKFKELLDMGVITQEEFDAKKKQLLGL